MQRVAALRADPGEQVTRVTLLLQHKATKNHFHPPPRLDKLVFRLRHVERPKRLGLLDFALVMATSIHRMVVSDGGQVTWRTWQPL